MTWLIPPPVPSARKSPSWSTGWFHAPSGMYDFALPAAVQNVDGLAVSSNCVPPTHVAAELVHSPLTASPWPGSGGLPAKSQPAAPASPDDTNTVWPCAAA